MTPDIKTNPSQDVKSLVERLIIGADGCPDWRAADELMREAAVALSLPQAVEPVALAHIRSTDTYLEIDLEVLDGEHLQPGMSPVKLYAHPHPAREDCCELMPPVGDRCGDCPGGERIKRQDAQPAGDAPSQTDAQTRDAVSVIISNKLLVSVHGGNAILHNTAEVAQEILAALSQPSQTSGEDVERIIVAVLDTFHDGQREKKARAIVAALSAQPTPIQAGGDVVGALETARQALEDVANPLGYLKRQAEAEGNQLGGMAYTIAYDLGMVQGIARQALAALAVGKGE